MAALTLSADGHYLTKYGKPFFYLADTCWSGFTNPTLDEWEYYLGVRRSQGFTALQINIMPQGDRSENTWDNPEPFETHSNGNHDFDRPNATYFERAATMTERAVAFGFTPALVLLWGDLVPGTWINRNYNSHTMRLDQVAPYAELVTRYFGRFDPVWIVSGDTNLPEETKPWFKTARDTLKRLRPDLPCMFHMGADQPLPDDWPDIYTIYSGHGRDGQEGAYKQAERRLAKPVKRPVINAEPCYEALGHGGGYGRFSGFEVRRAIWWGLMSGAKAGSAYGAHGVWSWHRTGTPFCAQQHWGEPLDWRAALTLPGTADMGFIRELFEHFRLFELDPAQQLLANMPEQVRLMATADRSRFAAYVPYARDLAVSLDLSAYNVTLVNLSERRFERPNVNTGAGSSTVAMLQDNSDAVVIGERNG